MNFVDTNYFLRFLLVDNKKQAQSVKQLFERASQGKESLISSTIVFFEIYWVLSSFYAKEKSYIIATLEQILKLPFIKFDNATILRDALILYKENNINLEDAYNLSFAKENKVDKFYTFDRKLNKFC